MNDAVECCLCLRDLPFQRGVSGGGRGICKAYQRRGWLSAGCAGGHGQYGGFLVPEDGDGVWILPLPMRLGTSGWRGRSSGEGWSILCGRSMKNRQYLGENAVNGKEKEFLELITFPPFRAYSPIQESLKERYPETKDGLRTMERLSEEAGDGGYRLLLHIYRRMPVPLVSWWLERRLNSPKRQNLYETLLDWIESASMEYPERQYEGSLNEERQKARKDAEEEPFGRRIFRDIPMVSKRKRWDHCDGGASLYHPGVGRLWIQDAVYGFSGGKRRETEETEGSFRERREKDGLKKTCPFYRKKKKDGDNMDSKTAEVVCEAVRKEKPAPGCRGSLYFPAGAEPWAPKPGKRAGCHPV